MYPYLAEWLSATRRSEDGLIAVLIVALVAVGLLWFYNHQIVEDMPKMRIAMLALFMVLTAGLVVMG
jgi:hypothetical protein